MDVKQIGGSGRGLGRHSRHTALFSLCEAGAEHGVSAGDWPAPENRGHYPTGRVGVRVCRGMACIFGVIWNWHGRLFAWGISGSAECQHEQFQKAA